MGFVSGTFPWDYVWESCTGLVGFFMDNRDLATWKYWEILGNTGSMYGNHMGLLGLYGIMYGI